MTIFFAMYVNGIKMYTFDKKVNSNNLFLDC
jgi:hypothetical protein